MVQHVTICGAGTMGGGIAIGCLAAGLDVTVLDTSEAALDRLRTRVAAHLARQIDKGRISAEGSVAAFIELLREIERYDLPGHR